MSHHEHVEHLKELARQLSCPEGEAGIKTGEHMNINNAFMASLTIDSLDLSEGDKVLEIGPGNGLHVNDLLEKYPQVTYSGIDISETMVSEARKRVPSARADFCVGNGLDLPFADSAFDAVYTVNTIYFWKEPLPYVQEMFRVLRAGGRLLLTFALKEFMEHLPFTQHGFELYDIDSATDLLQTAGFQIVHTNQQTEEILSNAGHPVVRTFVVVTAQK